MTTANATTGAAMEPDQVDLRRLPLAALIAAVAAVIGNLLVYYIALAASVPLLVPIGGPTAPLTPLPVAGVITMTVIPAVGAAILLALLGRFTARPILIFEIISAVFLVVSFFPVIGVPGDAATKVTLGLMHIIAAAAIVGVLVTRARKS